MNEQEKYKDWSIKQMDSEVIRGIKQIALDNDQTIPEAVNDCLIAYQDSCEMEEESWS